MSRIPKYADEAVFPQPHRMPISMNEARDAILPAQWGITKRESQIGAGSKTAAVLENGNAIASAGNSTLELPASERSDCDCCGKRRVSGVRLRWR